MIISAFNFWHYSDDNNKSVTTSIVISSESESESENENLSSAHISTMAGCTR